MHERRHVDITFDFLEKALAQVPSTYIYLELYVYTVCIYIYTYVFFVFPPIVGASGSIGPNQPKKCPQILFKESSALYGANHTITTCWRQSQGTDSRQSIVHRLLAYRLVYPSSAKLVANMWAADLWPSSAMELHFCGGYYHTCPHENSS